MVNKSQIELLHTLKNSDKPLSGAVLAKQLGVSRVALWKRFEALRTAGYQVQADRSGYRLVPGDKPLPWEFPGDEGKIFHFDTLESTMEEAFRLGMAGLADGAVVAEHQEAGRGRAGRTWESSGGDLLVTLVVRPDLPTSYIGALGLEALAALADTVSDLHGVTLGLKWPNDLTSDGKKVAGVLVEAWGPADRPRFYTIGLGLNVHGLPAVDRPVASLGSLGYPQADRRAILAGWRARVHRWAAAPVPNPDRWAAAAQPPAPVAVETFDGRTVAGVPLGFGRTGSLLLGRNNETIPIRFGETRRTQGVTL